jgi:hypothetical protein
MALADRAGLSDLLAEHLAVTCPNPVVKARTVLAGMLAGADDIDGMNLLRAGDSSRVLGGVRAPSTIGTFLRSFTHGHVLQLAGINRRLLSGLTSVSPGMVSDSGPVLLDLDDTMRQLHGYQKDAVAYGYNKIKGLNAIIATISTDHSPPIIAGAGLRRGNIRSGSHAAWHATRALNTIAETAGNRDVLVRADSAFYRQDLIAAARRAGASFSITIPQWKNVVEAISEIGQDAWTPISYPHAILDPDTGELVSDAEVAEVPFTAFTSHRLADQVDCRLVVRRVKRLGAAPTGQGALFQTYRFHAFVTDSSFDTVEADKRHRQHAVVEQVICELKDSVLAHLPSGRFAANEAWLGFAVIAFNISKAAAHAAGMHTARMASIRTRIIHVPMRLARRARTLIAHLPRQWPWARAWTRLWQTATGPPRPARH